MILDIGWRGLMIALVVLADLVVFADLARAELSSFYDKPHAERQTTRTAGHAGEATEAMTERKAP
jgi:hypothetical protein